MMRDECRVLFTCEVNVKKGVPPVADDGVAYRLR